MKHLILLLISIVVMLGNETILENFPEEDRKFMKMNFQVSEIISKKNLEINGLRGDIAELNMKVDEEKQKCEEKGLEYLQEISTLEKTIKELETKNSEQEKFISTIKEFLGDSSIEDLSKELETLKQTIETMKQKEEKLSEKYLKFGKIVQAGNGYLFRFKNRLYGKGDTVENEIIKSIEKNIVNFYDFKVTYHD